MRTSAIIILCSVILCSTYAIAVAEEGSSIWINPSYKHLLEPGFVPPKPTPIQRRTIQDTCRSYENVVEVIRENFINRKNSFSFLMVYDFQFSQVENILDQAYDEIASDDYLRLNVKFWSTSCNGYNGNVTVNYAVDYLTTFDQEQYVDQRVKEIISTIITNDMNDEQKVKATHDWIVLHVEYDQTYQEYSAYAALYFGHTVCQGYSLLTYKMLEKIDITSQIIESDEMNHAWNLVYLCGDWYHLDVTWDDPVNQSTDFIWYKYYNKSDDEIVELEHQWDFSAYPEAPVSYEEGICENWLLPIAGDINKKDGINLQDAILALQVCSGIELSETVYPDADVNGDEVIGIVEAVFALQTVAELRN